MLEALRSAHRAGIVHRDLKPENVMVRFDGYVKVLDFGLAARMPGSVVLQAESAAATDATVVLRQAGDAGRLRLSVPGQILGTIPYMSPEQIDGRDVDQRSDLFAFGIILHEMLTGAHPWPRRSPVDTLHAILHDDPPPIHATSLMHAELAAIVRKLLRKSPAERYASAEAVLEALGSHASPQGASAAALVTPIPLTSIAVLPFVFLNEVEERQALSLGFADALITMLGRLEDVTVLPTSAILNYSAGTDPARASRDIWARGICCRETSRESVPSGACRCTCSMRWCRKPFRPRRTTSCWRTSSRCRTRSDARWWHRCAGEFPPAVPTSRDRYSSDPEAYNEFMAGLRESYADRADTLERASGTCRRRSNGIPSSRWRTPGCPMS